MKEAKDPEKWMANEDDYETYGIQTKNMKTLDPDFIEPTPKQISYFE